MARPLREQLAIATLVLLIPVGAVMTWAAGAAYNDQLVQLRGGRHIKYPLDTALANLHMTLLDKMGVSVERFGDNTGKIELLSSV